MSSFTVHNKLGSWGENCAANYLQEKSYRVIARNWYNARGKRRGEIDIVATKDNALIFVEVKTSTKNPHGNTSPENHITQQKLRKLSAICSTYVAYYKLWNTPWRVDAIAITYTSRDDYDLRHLKNVFF